LNRSAPAVPVRIRILAVLFLLTFVNYLLRNNLSVAIESIQEEFHFTGQDVGWILGSFNLSYAIFQIPGGLFGDWLGPRLALTLIAAAWGVLTLSTIGFIVILVAYARINIPDPNDSATRQTTRVYYNGGSVEIGRSMVR